MGIVYRYNKIISMYEGMNNTSGLKKIEVAEKLSV